MSIISLELPPLSIPHRERGSNTRRVNNHMIRKVHHMIMIIDNCYFFIAQKERVRNHSATVIQATFRGHVTRQNVVGVVNND